MSTLSSEAAIHEIHHRGLRKEEAASYGVGGWWL